MNFMKIWIEDNKNQMEIRELQKTGKSGIRT
jgi:hypothetical protein